MHFYYIKFSIFVNLCVNLEKWCKTLIQSLTFYLIFQPVPTSHADFCMKLTALIMHTPPLFWIMTTRCSTHAGHWAFWVLCKDLSQFIPESMWGARLTKAYDVTIQRYRNSHAKIEDSNMHILRCMGSKFCVKFQRCPLKFYTKFWTHTPQYMHFTGC